MVFYVIVCIFDIYFRLIRWSDDIGFCVDVCWKEFVELWGGRYWVYNWFWLEGRYGYKMDKIIRLVCVCGGFYIMFWGKVGSKVGSKVIVG